MIKRFLSQHPLVIQILKFGVVGTSAFVIDNIIFWLFIHFADVNSYVSIAVAFLLTLVYNYILTTKWVFDSKRHGGKTVVVFTILSIIGLVITELVYSICNELIFPLLECGMNDYLELVAKIIASAVAMVFNFITRKIFLEGK